MSSTVVPLLFNWDAPRRRNLAFTGFLIGSIVAHIFCFYLFQIVYPPTVSLTPVPQRINLIDANTEEGARLVSWADAEDPALVTTTRRPSDARRFLVGKIQHVPSYSSVQPMLQAAPPMTVDLRIPSAEPAGPMRTSSRVAPKAIGTVATTVLFSREFERLGQPAFAPIKFQASGKDAPENAQFRIGVDSHGVVRYCFALNSSGDAALDAQARKHLALCRFATKATTSPSNAIEDLAWGIATIEWGNDVAAASEQPTPRAP